VPPTAHARLHCTRAPWTITAFDRRKPLYVDGPVSELEILGREGGSSAGEPQGASGR
jgi:hypothetical protein